MKVASKSCDVFRQRYALSWLVVVAAVGVVSDQCLSPSVLVDPNECDAFNACCVVCFGGQQVG